MRQLGVALIMFLLFAGVAWAETAKLTWNANTESDLAGYKVYERTATGSYGAPLATLGKVVTYTTPIVTTPGTRFYTLTAYDLTGNESKKASEVSKVFVGTPVVPKPVAPILSATATSPTSISATWLPVTGVTVDVRYAVKGTGWGASASMGCAGSPCAIATVTPDTSYEVQAVAYRGTPNVDVVYSPLSAVVTIHTPKVPVDPVPSKECMVISTQSKTEITIKLAPCVN